MEGGRCLLLLVFSILAFYVLGFFLGLYGELVSSHIDETVKSTTLGSVICNLPDSATTVFYSRLESPNTPSIYLLQGISIILIFR